jgi:hypothetical protein
MTPKVKAGIILLPFRIPHAGLIPSSNSAPLSLTSAVQNENECDVAVLGVRGQCPVVLPEVVSTNAHPALSLGLPSLSWPPLTPRQPGPGSIAMLSLRHSVVTKVLSVDRWKAWGESRDPRGPGAALAPVGLHGLQSELLAHFAVSSEDTHTPRPLGTNVAC